MKLKISLKSDIRGQIGSKSYGTEINAENFKEIALVLIDLKNHGLPIDKAVKEFQLSKSDWNIALGG